MHRRLGHACFCALLIAAFGLTGCGEGSSSTGLTPPNSPGDATHRTQESTQDTPSRQHADTHERKAADDVPRGRDKPGRKRLLMHYMPWYQTPAVTGYWGSHWTGHQKQHDPGTIGPDGLPDIWSHYHPLIGLYDSADRHVLECQLLQMKLAGIDGVIVDWYGIADAADYPPIHAATQVLFEVAGRLGMQFAVCYEDRTIQFQTERGMLTEEQAAEQLAQTFAWMQEHWFGRPHYATVGDRPMVLNFGPIYMKDPEPWGAAIQPLSPRPMFYALHHLWRGIGADGGFTWVHKDDWAGDPDSATVVQRLLETYAYTSDDPLQIIPSAVPGFRDVYENGYPVLEHRGGLTLRESLQACMQGPWPTAQLVTWNDYGEGTIIEPTHEFGYLFLEIIQQARIDEGADDFAVTPADLRLPARLLALRRAGLADPDELDRIAGLLSREECDQARAALDRAEAQAAE